MNGDVTDETKMPDESKATMRLSLEAQVTQILAQQLGKTSTEAERSRIYDVVDKLLQRDLDLARSQVERELQIDLRAREDQRRRARQSVVSTLGVAVIFIIASVVLVLKGSLEVGLFMLGCTAAFVGEAMVGYP